MDHYLMLAKWSTNFCPIEDKIVLKLVWVQFPNLLLKLFDEEVLMIMGNTVGKAIRVYATTMSAKRGGS